MRPLDTTRARFVAWDDPSKVVQRGAIGADAGGVVTHGMLEDRVGVEAHPFGERQDEAVWSDDHWLSL